MPLLDRLKAITSAAAAGVPFKDIAARIGMTSAAWESLLLNHRQEVALAIAVGRTQAQIRVNARLEACSNHGKIAATLYILRHWHGWHITNLPRFGVAGDESGQSTRLSKRPPRVAFITTHG